MCLLISHSSHDFLSHSSQQKKLSLRDERNSLLYEINYINGRLLRGDKRGPRGDKRRRDVAEDEKEETRGIKKGSEAEASYCWLEVVREDGV